LVRPTYIGRKNNRGRRKVKLRDIEGLAQEISRVELVKDSRARRLSALRLLRLSTNVHVANSLSDTTNTGCGLRGTSSWVSLVGSLITILRSLGSSGLLCAVTLLRILVALRGSSLRLSLITSIAWLSGRSAELLSSSCGLTTSDSIGAGANFEGLSRISSLLLLVALFLGLLGGSRVLVSLLRLFILGSILIILLGRIAAEAITRRGHRHG
jgi:hypothetical protein